MDVNLEAVLFKTKETILHYIGFGDGSLRRAVRNNTRHLPFGFEVYADMLQSGEIWEHGTGRPGDPVMVVQAVCKPNPNPRQPMNQVLVMIQGPLRFVQETDPAAWIHFYKQMLERGKNPATELQRLLEHC